MYVVLFMHLDFIKNMSYPYCHSSQTLKVPFIVYLTLE